RLVSSVGTKLNPIKTQHIREIRPRENPQNQTVVHIYLGGGFSRIPKSV
ncbi:unnamed protein product, partial [Brassica oleracea var. botrytis]